MKNIFKKFGSLFGQNPLKIWGIILLFGTMIAFLNIGIIITNDLANRDAITIKYVLINELSGVYTSLLLLPFIFWMYERFPLKRGTFWAYLPLHLLATMIFGATHTTLMYLSRTAIYALLNLGDYDTFYGLLKYRYLMEYQKQFVVYWLVYGTIFLIKSLRESQQQKLRASQLEQQLTKTRLQALQMQLNPHFLFNTLNMISSTMYEDIKAADKMIAYLSDLLRLTLAGKGVETHSLEKELALLDLYIAIMRARFRDKLQVHINARGEALQAKVPGFILQPLVENSIKYGMESLKTVTIEIAARKEQDKLFLLIKDNGPGIEKDFSQRQNKGVGLSNTAERLEKLYGGNHLFQMENLSGGGLQITLKIPFQKAREEALSQ